MTLVGESDLFACGPPARFSVNMAGSAVKLAGSVHKSRGDNVRYVCGHSRRDDVCCVCECYRGGHSGDGCDLAATLC